METVFKMAKQMQQNGYVVIKQFFTEPELTTFEACVNDVTAREERPGALMKYFETSVTTKEELLNRVENFIDEYPALKSVVLGQKLLALFTQLTDKHYVLFKDKINFKMSGGGGFAIHQDSPAFSLFTQKEMLIVMVPIDVVDQNNGCMQVASNYFNQEALPHEQGTIPDKYLTTVQWSDILLQPKDIMIFSSFLIHRSADNLSPLPRRCFYLTYNPVEEGNLRADYFAYKRKHFPPRIERGADENFDHWKARLSKQII